jgi:hypothetical protein
MPIRAAMMSDMRRVRELRLGSAVTGSGSHASAAASAISSSSISASLTSCSSIRMTARQDAVATAIWTWQAAKNDARHTSAAGGTRLGTMAGPVELLEQGLAAGQVACAVVGQHRHNAPDGVLQCSRTSPKSHACQQIDHAACCQQQPCGGNGKQHILGAAC